MTPGDVGVSEKRDNKRSIRPSHLYATIFSHVWINLSMVSGIDQLGEVAGQQHRKWREWGGSDGLMITEAWGSPTSTFGVCKVSYLVQ